jgi:undecaprenyl diphosphate synthase
MTPHGAPPRDPATPRHIAIIMDGNGRWARQRGFERIRGHEHGAAAVRGAIDGCGEAGVEFLTLYAFSTENWKRPKAEVAALMALLERFLADNTAELVEKKVRVQAIGHIEDLPAQTRRKLADTIDATAAGTDLTLVLALSYSGRAEILDAVRAIARQCRDGGLDPDAIDSACFAGHLATRDWPDPDLLIRTSGEMRISNFLLWQLSYTELYVTPTLWPDFRKQDLLDAIAEFAKRHRRFGGL